MARIASGDDLALFASFEWITPPVPPVAEDVVQPVGAMRVLEGQPPRWAEAPTKATSKAPPTISAKAAVVIDEASLAVVYGKNERDSLLPASTTKIATAILAIEHGGLDEVVRHNVDSADMAGSSLMGIRPRDRFTLRDLLYGMMLRSGNDASLAIGRHIAGSDEAFVEQMNQLLARLDLHDSHFVNPHGLHHVEHRASAYDLAMLSRYAMQYPEFVELVGAKEWTAKGSRTLKMENRINGFLDGYPGADGLKSGFTKVAGQTFVGSATRDGQRLYVVLLTTGDRLNEAAALLDWAFENHDWSGTGRRVVREEPELDEPSTHPGRGAGQALGRGQQAREMEHPAQGRGVGQGGILDRAR